jgi:cold shock CspA family protein
MGFGNKGKGAVQKPWLKNQNTGGTWVQAPKAGKGKGKGNAASTVPPNFKVNPSKRYTGTVTNFWKFKGYGFITPDEPNIIPGADRVFAFWKDISSSDRFPSLQQGAPVQFSLQKVDEHGVAKLRAANITGQSGEELTFQDESDGKKTYVGGQNLRYTGKLKFFSPKNGFGYIEIDDGYDYGEFTVPKELRVETAEMNCGGQHPARQNDVQVEFGIWQTKKGAFKAYNVTGSGGTHLTAQDR